MTTITCRKCSLTKSSTEYYNKPQSKCKECVKADSRAYIATHQPQQIAYQKQYYQKNKEKRRAYRNSRKKEYAKLYKKYYNEDKIKSK